MTSAGIEPTVVVLTALDLEYQAVRAYLVDLREVEHPEGTLFEVGRLPDAPGLIALAVTTTGNNAAAALAERAIAGFRPEAVLFIGVAGALHDDLNLGDVVVATWVYALHSGRIDSALVHPRPRAWEAPHDLEQRARSINRAGTWTRLLPASASVPAVRFAPIAAGEVVLDSRTAPLFQRLQEHYNDAVAIEMEGAGVALAGHLNRSVPALVVRGISDRADGEKRLADKGGSQPRAAVHAAAFGLTVAAAVLTRTAGATDVAPRRAQASLASGAWVARLTQRAQTSLRALLFSVLVTAAALLLCGIGWHFADPIAAMQTNTSPPPPVTTSTPTSTPTPNPHESRATAPSGNELVVMYPPPGKVGYRVIVKVAAPPLPGNTKLLIMVRVAGGSWYPTQCLPEETGTVSTCTYAQFGADPNPVGATFELVALALPDDKAKALLDRQPYRGAIDDLNPIMCSKPYSYQR